MFKENWPLINSNIDEQNVKKTQIVMQHPWSKNFMLMSFITITRNKNRNTIIDFQSKFQGIDYFFQSNNSVAINPSITLNPKINFVF